MWAVHDAGMILQWPDKHRLSRSSRSAPLEIVNIIITPQDFWGTYAHIYIYVIHMTTYIVVKRSTHVGGAVDLSNVGR